MALERWIVMLAAWFGAVSSAMALATFQSAVRVVALSGEQAPGADAGVLYRDFDPPIINNLGQTAFGAGAALVAGPHYDQYGVWFEHQNSLNLADIAPAAVDPPNILSFAFNDRDEVVIGLQDAIKIATVNSVTTIAKAGDALPGEPDHAFSTFGRPSVNESGTVAFAAAATSPMDCCDDSGIWSVQQGVLMPIARVGASVPNAPGEQFLDTMTAARINDSGKLAFYDGVGYSNAVLRTESNGQYEKVATVGTAVPGLGAGVEFLSVGAAAINGRGDTLFMASLGVPSYSAAFENSLWRYHAGNLQLIARAGDPAPGAGSGITFADLGSGYYTASSKNSGDVAFAATLQGDGIDISNNSSIWKVHDDNLQLVAKAGSPAPGFPAGSQFTSFSWPSMNNLGQIVFQGVVEGAGGTPDGGTHVGIWAQDATGALRLIVRDGDTIDVDPGPGVDLCSVAGINLATNDFLAINTLARGASDQVFDLNDRGQVAFGVTFLDGSRGIVVSNLLAVPEPGALAMIVVAMIAVSARSSRRRMTPVL